LTFSSKEGTIPMIISNNTKSRIFYALLILVVLVAAAYVNGYNTDTTQKESTENELVPGLIYVGTDENGNYIYKKGMVPKNAMSVDEYTNSVILRNWNSSNGSH